MHKVWLGRIYEWAGDYRQVNLTKGSFSFAAARQIPFRLILFGGLPILSRQLVRGHMDAFDGGRTYYVRDKGRFVFLLVFQIRIGMEQRFFVHPLFYQTPAKRKMGAVNYDNHATQFRPMEDHSLSG